MAGARVCPTGNIRHTPDFLIFFIDPVAVFLNQGDEASDSIGGGYVFLYALFAFVEADFTGGSSDISVIGVGHFARAVYDTAHHTYFQSFKMRCRSLDVAQCRLKVIKSASDMI